MYTRRQENQRNERLGSLEYWSDGVMGSETQHSSNPALQFTLLHPRPHPLESWIEEIAQSVAEQIDTEHGDEYAHSRKERQPPGGADIDARIGEHGAPGGNFRRHADAEKAQARFGDNRRCHGEGSDDQRGLNQIWNDMTGDDLSVAGA